MLTIAAKSQVIDSLKHENFTLEDSIPDLLIDSDSIPTFDSVQVTNKKNKDAVEQIVNYEATDSILLSMHEQMVYLFGSGILNTEGMELKAGRIEINMDKSELSAFGFVDSTGKEVEKPNFTDDDQSFSSKSMTYNFKTKKGVVKDVVTEQADGYLHGTIAKIHPNKEIHILHGKFTTCDADHPHFYIELTKAKVIPKKRIVAGPVYFVILDVPLYPIGLPYGFFPNQKNKSSGILMPKFNKQILKSFGLQGGGYYFAVNDYFDLTLLGDIYSSGSWLASAATSFKKRYKFSGNAQVQYSKLKYEETIIPDTFKTPDTESFRFTASYVQDTKANPTNNFSANINFDRGGFSKQNAQDINEFVNGTNSSSISYRKTFRELPLNLSVSANGTQNLNDSTTNLKLPTVSFNMQRIYPFKRKNASGKSKWYEDIGLTVNSNFDNSLDTPDSLMFKKEVFEKMEYGFKYTAPLSTSFNLFKFITVSPSLNYTGRVYPNYIKKDTSLTVEGEIVIDTISKITHNFDFGFSMPFSTKLYGLIEVKAIKFVPLKNLLDKMGLVAIRHVASPSVGYSYKPDFSSEFWNYYELDPGDTTYQEKYSYYENGIFGYPGAGEQQSMTFSLGNNFEMKVKNSKDTVNEFTKVKLLDRLSISSSYNFAADSLNLSVFSFSGGTTLFEKIKVDFSGSLDPYTLNSEGKRVDKFEYEINKKLGRFTTGKISVNTSLNNEMFSKFFDSEKDNEEENDEYYNYFNVPWTLTSNYNFIYSKIYIPEDQKYEVIFTQTIQLSINLSPTPKWNFTMSSGYDFDKSKITSSSIMITRDLHCWDMSLNIIPFGKMKSYTFMIGIKSSIFDGIDYKREKYWEDNPDY
jgi:hypothetical protein